MVLLRLTKYGRREWGGGTIVAAVGCATLGVMAWQMGWSCLLPIGPILLVWLWVLWFFRDPDRTGPDEQGVFLSPADGVVADVTPVGPDSDLGAEGTKVGVFMSIFNVHVNRAPCDGRIEAVEHRDGAFLDVRKPEAAFKNESATIRMTHRCGGREHPVVVRQIAGLVARRIVTDLAKGRDVRRGQRIGMIKFGSRLELLLPRPLVGEVRVAVGQKVFAGRTVLVAAPESSGHGT